MSALTLEIDEFIPALPERVFAAWTSEAELLQWWGPPGGSCSEASLDLRVGGRYCLTNRLGDGTEIDIWGEFIEIDEPNHLKYTWSTQPGQLAAEEVSVRFDPEGDGTRVTVTHHRIKTVETLANHRLGWASCLTQLSRAL